MTPTCNPTPNPTRAPASPSGNSPPPLVRGPGTRRSAAPLHSGSTKVVVVEDVEAVEAVEDVEALEAVEDVEAVDGGEPRRALATSQLMGRWYPLRIGGTAG